MISSSLFHQKWNVKIKVEWISTQNAEIALGKRRTFLLNINVLHRLCYHYNSEHKLWQKHEAWASQSSVIGKLLMLDIDNNRYNNSYIYHESEEYERQCNILLNANRESKLIDECYSCLSPRNIRLKQGDVVGILIQLQHSQPDFNLFSSHQGIIVAPAELA